MKRLLGCCLLFTIYSFSLFAQEEREVKLKFIETSDIHGNFFPYNFITKKIGFR